MLSSSSSSPLLLDILVNSEDNNGDRLQNINQCHPASTKDYEKDKILVDSSIDKTTRLPPNHAQWRQTQNPISHNSPWKHPIIVSNTSHNSNIETGGGERIPYASTWDPNNSLLKATRTLMNFFCLTIAAMQWQQISRAWGARTVSTGLNTNWSHNIKLSLVVSVLMALWCRRPFALISALI